MPVSSAPTQDHVQEKPAFNPEAFMQNLQEVAARSQEVFQYFLKNADQNVALPSKSVQDAFADMFDRLMQDPVRLWREQLELGHEYVRLMSGAYLNLIGEKAPPLYPAPDRDRRFKDAAWSENVIFDFLKQSYVLTSDWLRHLVHEVEGVDDKTRAKLEFYTRQFTDAMAPSNFAFTNPEVIRKTIETNGENLVKGLQNLLSDLSSNTGIPRINMTDLNAFEVGKNLAITPGKVVFQNELLQLIQYSPSTQTVYQTPLLIVSPWINKYYVLDLQPGNSYVRWLVDQGFTVFITSWVNPSEQHAHQSFEDYMSQGLLAALHAIQQATNEKQVNVIGYCIGGTLLASTLAYLKAKGQDSMVRSATFLTTLMDFAQSGDLGVFIDEAQLTELENSMNAKGYMGADEMALTFNMLRSNELIWNFVVNNYLLGNDPFPFDLLYWNMDSTRLPAAMHSYYLRHMYLYNDLVKPGGITLGNIPIDLHQITTPSYFLSTQADHIAPWQSTYAATQILGGVVRFVLSGSGHIAGVVNPPVKKKYGFWVNESLPTSPDAWMLGAAQHPGSWWEDWTAWMKTNHFTGEKIMARQPKNAIEDAPGSYVRMK